MLLVIIGPHSLNTLQARVFDVKLYPDDVMGGAPVLHPVQIPPSLYYRISFLLCFMAENKSNKQYFEKAVSNL